MTSDMRLAVNDAITSKHIMIDNSYEGFTTPDNGELTFGSAVEQRQFNQFLSQFDGQKLWLSLESKQPNRTDRQNRYYWLYLEKISQQSGHSPEELHHTFKHAFLSPVEKHGINDTYTETPSTKNLSKSKFSNYMEAIYRETEVELPDPTRYKVDVPSYGQKKMNY
jgi:hypothetical protein